MKNDLIQVVTRVEAKVPMSANPTRPLKSNFEEFAETKLPMWYDIKFISFPSVMPRRYLINTLGRVIDTYKGIERFPYANNMGYLTITLQTDNDMCAHYGLHQLVAYEFCDPPEFFKDLIVNHIDTNKHNDWCNNLEWITMTANNQHARKMYADINRKDDGRPDNMQTSDIHKICKLFEQGKSNSEVMNIFGWQPSNRNHTFLRDIRNRSTWTNVSNQYNFDASSKKHAYTKEEKDVIKQHILDGKSDPEIFAIMNGREYIPSIDRLDSKNRTISSLRISLRNRGYGV